jgi:Dyp-type peroxidase family
VVNFYTEDSKDPDEAKEMNNFIYENEVCPVSAHIRKTNIREDLTETDKDPRALRTRIIRNGIPYGTDYKGNENNTKLTRGLLFACYQAHIEDGFQNMQVNWSNDSTFRTGDPGQDPIIGQVAQKSRGVNGDLETFFNDKFGIRQSVKFQQLVTMKGGEYFFVPSIPALCDDLGMA